MSIIIDPEFKSLIPPLTAEEYTQLERNIVKEGIRDALVVWPQADGNDILIDGHNRFNISAAHSGIQFQIKRKDFKDRDEAKLWIIRNQLGRRNLPLIDEVTLRDSEKNILAKQAKEKAIEGNSKGGSKSVKNSCPSSAQTRQEKRENSTDYKIAKAAGTSEDTVRKVRAINEKATDKTRQLVREGKLSINQAYNSTREKKPDPVQQAKDEHKEYQQKKAERTVSIQDAQIDKTNKAIISRALLEEVQKLLNTVEKFGFNHSSDELNGLYKLIDKDEREILSSMCERSQLILEKIKYGIQRRN